MNTEELRSMIASSLNLEGLPEEEQEKIIDQFSENALKRITISLYEKLPESAKAEFATLGDASDSEGLLKLFQANIPDLNSFVQGEVAAEVEAFKKFQAGS